MRFSSSSPEATRAAAADFARGLKIGDAVLLEGGLGAGKTTFVRGLLEALGYDGPVRSPTFNLIQTFDTEPPVMHADLYRLQNTAGLGLDEYLDTHLCLIEWPDRATDLLDPESCWRVRIDFAQEGREIEIVDPTP